MQEEDYLPGIKANVTCSRFKRKRCVSWIGSRMAATSMVHPGRCAFDGLQVLNCPNSIIFFEEDASGVTLIKAVQAVHFSHASSANLDMALILTLAYQIDWCNIHLLHNRNCLSAQVSSKRSVVPGVSTLWRNIKSFEVGFFLHGTSPFCESISALFKRSENYYLQVDFLEKHRARKAADPASVGHNGNSFCQSPSTRKCSVLWWWLEVRAFRWDG